MKLRPSFINFAFHTANCKHLRITRDPEYLFNMLSQEYALVVPPNSPVDDLSSGIEQLILGTNTCSLSVSQAAAVDIAIEAQLANPYPPPYSMDAVKNPRNQCDQCMKRFPKIAKLDLPCPCRFRVTHLDSRAKSKQLLPIYWEMIALTKFPDKKARGEAKTLNLRVIDGENIVHVERKLRLDIWQTRNATKSTITQKLFIKKSLEDGDNNSAPQPDIRTDEASFRAYKIADETTRLASEDLDNWENLDPETKGVRYLSSRQNIIKHPLVSNYDHGIAFRNLSQTLRTRLVVKDPQAPRTVAKTEFHIEWKTKLTEVGPAKPSGSEEGKCTVENDTGATLYENKNFQQYVGEFQSAVEYLSRGNFDALAALEKGTTNLFERSLSGRVCMICWDEHGSGECPLGKSVDEKHFEELHMVLE